MRTHGPKAAGPGGTATFEAEALACVDSLYRTALRLTHVPADAEDLVQETYLKAFRAADRFQAGTNLRAWLFTILHNTARNRARDRARDTGARTAASSRGPRHRGNGHRRSPAGGRRPPPAQFRSPAPHGARLRSPARRDRDLQASRQPISLSQTDRVLRRDAFGAARASRRRGCGGNGAAAARWLALFDQLSAIWRRAATIGAAQRRLRAGQPGCKSAACSAW